MPSFNWKSNPLYLLGVSPRDGHASIAEAAEESVASERLTESASLAAQQSLMAAKPRLNAELAWLPGLTPSRASKIVETILGSTESTAESLNSLTGLPAANAAAQLCVQREPSLDALRRLVKAQSEIDAADILADVNADREVADFPLVSQALIDGALQDLQKRHVEAANQAISNWPDAASNLSSLVDEFLGENDKEQDFVEEIVDRYYEVNSQNLSAIRERLIAAVRGFGASGAAHDLKIAISAMQSWHEEIEPRRTLFASKRLDEPLSAELFQSIREYCKTLVRQDKEPDRARQVLSSLRDEFGDVPSVVDQIDRDVAELSEGIMADKLEQAAAPLITVLEEAQKDFNTTALRLTDQAFDSTSTGLMGRLYSGFALAATALAGTEHEDTPWRIIRQLGVDLNNHADAPQEAKTLVEGLFAFQGAPMPDSIRTSLMADLRKLQELNLNSRLLAALKTKRPAKEILPIINALEPLTDDEGELATLKQLKSKVIADGESRRNKYIGWGVFAVIAIIYVAAHSGDQTTSANNPNVSTSDTTSAPSPAADSPSTSAAPVPQDQTSPPSDLASPSPVTGSQNLEVQPPVSEGRSLSHTELTYCLFQSARIGQIKASLPSQPNDYEVDTFNALIRDLRARCIGNKYYDSDKAAVDNAVAAASSDIQSDSAAVIAGWRTQEGSSGVGQDPLPLLNPSVANDARNIERRLSTLGYFSGSIDGVWAADAKQALTAFRLANNLADTTDWDAPTQVSLFSGTGK